MIFERTGICSLYSSYSIYCRMVAAQCRSENSRKAPTRSSQIVPGCALLLEGAVRLPSRLPAFEAQSRDHKPKVSMHLYGNYLGLKGLSLLLLWVLCICCTGTWTLWEGRHMTDSSCAFVWQAPLETRPASARHLTSNTKAFRCLGWLLRVSN